MTKLFQNRSGLNLLAVIGLLFTFSSLNAQETTLATEMGEFLGAKDTTHPDWFKESFLEFEEDIEEAAAENKRLILYFHQDGCPYCNKLVEENFVDPDISDKVRSNFDLVAINMWGDREVVQVGGQAFSEKTLAEALQVHFTPTLLFFNENKEIALRLNGYYPPFEFVQALDFVSGKHESSTTFPQYVSALKAHKSQGNLVSSIETMTLPVDLTSLSGKPVAILFEEPECENCNLLHNKTFQDPSAPELLDQFNIIQVNRWADTPIKRFDGSSVSVKDWASELGLGFSPAIVLFDASGNPVITVDAMFKTFHVLGVFDYVASGAYQTEPSFQRYLSAKAEHIREQGIDVDIWKY